MAKNSKNSNAPEVSFFRRELTALLFLLLGIFLSISLFSYSPQDPSFLSMSTSNQIHNWGGILGAYLADTLLNLLGGAAYFVGLFLLFVSVLFFSGKRDRIGWAELPIYFISIILIAIFFQLGPEQLEYDTTTLEAGGLVGAGLTRVGQAYLGRPGVYLIVIFGFLLLLVWSTHLSLRAYGVRFSALLAQFVVWFRGQMAIYQARLLKAFGKWKEERQALKKENKRAEITPSKPVISKFSPKIPTVPKVEEVAPFVSEIEDEEEDEIAPVERLVADAVGDDHSGPKILERVDKKKTRNANASPQLELQHLTDGYQLPAIAFLDTATPNQEIPIDEESLKMNARLLENKLLDFNIEGKVTEIHPGPVITMYEFQPAPGVKLSRISNLVDDLCLAMGGRQVRIVAPLPNKPAIGIEIPNNQRETVWLKDIIADDKFQRSDSRLIMAFGKDIEGIPFVADLAKMPHLLVAGATGSGKSVAINSMILSILYKAAPEEVRLIMVDPKMLELSIYEGIPHLLLPVVTEPKKASLALRWAVREMERRYRLLSDINARNIQNYNNKIESKDYTSRAKEVAEAAGSGLAPEIEHSGKIPYIVIIIDELADLMMVSSREVEESITRLAQMARAAGIHLILATQRPSVDVLTGVIKANFPARISFKVSSKHDARTVLDTIGSERLLGNGDMLFIPPGVAKLTRVHGAFITETEVQRVVDFLKTQAKPVYDESILKPVEGEGSGEMGEGGEEDGDRDELYDQAVAIVAETKQASISMIQRKLRIGYNRAARMIEKMESEGIVSPPSGAGHRQVLVSSFES